MRKARTFNLDKIGYKTEYLQFQFTKEYLPDLIMLACFEWIAKFDILGDVIFPLLVGIFAFIGTRKLDEWGAWRRQSMLGVAKCNELLEEVETGIGVMNRVKMWIQKKEIDGKKSVGDLPRLSWSGMNTISDEMLVRLLCLSVNEEVREFPISDIKTHLKNYFGNMCENFDQVTHAIGKGEDWEGAALFYLGKGNYLKEAEDVKKMLLHAKELLEANAEAWPPK